MGVGGYKGFSEKGIYYGSINEMYEKIIYARKKNKGKERI